MMPSSPHRRGCSMKSDVWRVYEVASRNASPPSGRAWGSVGARLSEERQPMGASPWAIKIVWKDSSNLFEFINPWVEENRLYRIITTSRRYFKRHGPLVLMNVSARGIWRINWSSDSWLIPPLALATFTDCFALWKDETHKFVLKLTICTYVTSSFGRRRLIQVLPAPIPPTSSFPNEWRYTALCLEA